MTRTEQTPAMTTVSPDAPADAASSIALLAAVASLVALGGLALIYARWLTEAPLAVGAVQIALGGGMALLALGLRTRGRDSSPLAHAGFWVLAAGPFGAAIAFASAAAGALNRASLDLRADVAALIAEPETAAVEDMVRALRDDRLRISGALATCSLRDVLAGVNQPAKLRALGALSREYRPELAPALRLGLMDSDPAVRVLAAGVLSRLQEQHGARIEQLANVAQSAPGSVAHARALAAAHMDFANSGLLSAERQRAELDRAEACLAACRDATPRPEMVAPAIQPPETSPGAIQPRLAPQRPVGVSIGASAEHERLGAA